MLCNTCVWRKKSIEACKKVRKGNRPILDVTPRSECKRHYLYGHETEINRIICDDYISIKDAIME